MAHDGEPKEEARMVVLAIIGPAHGLRGEVRIRSFTDDPLAFGRYGPLQGSDGRTYRVVSARPAGTAVIARLAGIEDRTAAEALNGITLSVPRHALGEADEDEFFHADLIGLKVMDATGADHGGIIAIHDFGGGTMLEIRRPGAASRMIPFTRAAVPKVEIDAGRVLVDPVAAGLTEDEQE